MRPKGKKLELSKFKYPLIFRERERVPYVLRRNVMDAQTEQQSGDTRAVLAKIKEPTKVGEEYIGHGTVENGSVTNPDCYTVKHEDGSTERYQIIRLGKENFVIRTKQETVATDGGSKKLVTYDYDAANKVYVPRESSAGDFEAMLRGVATTREKGSITLWDGVTADGKKTGGMGLKVTTYDAPVARPHLISLLNREKLLPTPRYV